MLETENSTIVDDNDDFYDYFNTSDEYENHNKSEVTDSYQDNNAVNGW